MPRVETDTAMLQKPKLRPPKNLGLWVVAAVAVGLVIAERLQIIDIPLRFMGLLAVVLGVILVVVAVIAAVTFGVARWKALRERSSALPPASSLPRGGPIPPIRAEEVAGPADSPARGAVRERASAGEPPRRRSPEPVSDVLISVSAPAGAAPGSSFVARFAAYAPELQEQTLELLRQLAGGSEPYANLRECRWAHNTLVTVRLSARGLLVAPEEQTFTWRGGRNLLDFVVDVPPSATPADTVLRFDVMVEGVNVAPIALSLSIDETGDEERTLCTTPPARTAFASYAREDKTRVLDRVAAVRIAAGLDVFLDCLSLRPNERWKPELERKILDSDLFLLFWSPAARSSEWVTWEWRTAIGKKRPGHFQLHPLAYADPPPEFADLHVGDVLMSLRELEERRG